MKLYKKYLIFLGILVILTPIGLILPEYFHAGDAWGEWSVDKVKEQTGYEPAGMKKDAEIYSAPIPDYNIGKENDKISKRSVNYIISGLVGAGLIILVTFGVSKLMAGKKE
jgi:cobalt/nickel transport protein